jgi:hypothetical protein
LLSLLDPRHDVAALHATQSHYETGLLDAKDIVPLINSTRRKRLRSPR